MNISLCVRLAKLHNFFACFITGLLPSLQNAESEVTVSNYEQRYPTHVDDVADVINQILSFRLTHPEFCGVWHWSSNEKMTKYTMVKTMSEVFNLPMEHVKPDNEPSKGAPRPYNSGLDTSVLENLGIKKRIPFRDGIRACLQSFV